MVPVDQVVEATRSGGARLAAEPEYDAARLQARYGGPGSAAVAAGVGAARGLGGMFGVPTDALALSFAETLPGLKVEDDPFRGRVERSPSEVLRERLNAYNELHPYASTAGELAGFAGGSLLGGGLVGRAGALAEKSASALGLGRFGASTASGAAEMSLYEGGKAASDAALANEDITAEKIVAGMGHGALIGGLAGGAFSVLGEGLGAARRLTRAGRPVLDGVEGEGGAVADYVQRQADVKTIEAMGGSAEDLRALENRVSGGYRRVAQALRADIEATTGKSIGFHGREALREYAVARKEQLGKELGEQLEKLDAAQVGIAPDPVRFAKKVRDEVLASRTILQPDGAYAVAPGEEETVRAVKGWLDDVERAFGENAPTFTEWQKARAALDKQIQAAAKSSPKLEALRQVHSFMDAELVRAGDEAAATMGGSFSATYRAKSALYESVTKAEELTEGAVFRDLASNGSGLPSRIAKIVGGAGGHAAGGPLGGLAAGALSAFANHVIERRGDMLAADLLDRVASVMGARRIAARTEAQLERGVRAMIPTKTPVFAALAPAARAVATPLGVRLTGDRRKDYEHVSDRVTAAATSIPATTDRLAHSLGDLPQHAPKVAQAVTTTALRGLDFLTAKLPAGRRDPYNLQPQLQLRPRASDAEISQYMRYAEAVDHPLVVLREVKSGTLTRDHIEAVKAVYPNLYDEMRSTVVRTLAESKSALPYSRRIQLGILLDIPTDATLAPDFTRAIQATFTSDEKAGAESPPPHLARPINVAGSTQTATQAATERVP